MPRDWSIKPVDEGQITRLAQELSVPPIIARLLIHRGADSASQANDFLCADLSTLPDPNQMTDLKKAVQWIRQAISHQRKILVVGDYDVDGLTSTALLVRVIRALKGEVQWHIPHRMTDGYGLKAEVIQQAARSGVTLLVATDCGTTSFEELRIARRLGMESIVVDHHELLPAGRPPACALLNPLQPGCRYPTKGLASVGVAFTLARGLLSDGSAEFLWDQLDLVALGTVADCAPLIGENRTLVKVGLHRLGGTRKPGLRALLSRVKLEGVPLTSEEISFVLAPRLNAMGRIGSAQNSLRLLITEDREEGQSIAREMDQKNKARGQMERQAFARALAKVEREVNFRSDRVIVLGDDQWHPGVAGIIATRLTSRFHRPTVVISFSGSVGRGSARSIRAFPLVEAFEQVKEHLLEFGGHPMAAGLTISREKLHPFREAINRIAQEQIDPGELTPCLEADGELPLSSVTQGLIRDMELLAPFGVGNPWPVFISHDARLPAEQKRTRFSPLGIRFTVEDADGRPFEALQPRQELWEGWNLHKLPGGPVALAYSPLFRRGENGLEIKLKLKDLRIPSGRKTTHPV